MARLMFACVLKSCSSIKKDSSTHNAHCLGGVGTAGRRLRILETWPANDHREVDVMYLPHGRQNQLVDFA